MESIEEFKKKIYSIDWEKATIPNTDCFTIYLDYGGTEGDFMASMESAIEIADLWWPTVNDRPNPEEGISFNAEHNIFQIIDPVVFAKGLIRDSHIELIYTEMNSVINALAFIQEWCEFQEEYGNIPILDDYCEEYNQALDWAYIWIEKKNLLLNLIADKLGYEL